MVHMILLRRLFASWIWSIFFYQTCCSYLSVAGDGGGGGSAATINGVDDIDVDAAWNYFEQGNEVNSTACLLLIHSVKLNQYIVIDMYAKVIDVCAIVIDMYAIVIGCVLLSIYHSLRLDFTHIGLLS